MDDIVKDSSIWSDPNSTKLLDQKDNSVRIGVVKEAIESKDTDEVKYLVEVVLKNNLAQVLCSSVVRYGGLYNYEEYSLRGYNQGSDDKTRGPMAINPGDNVLIAYVGGSSREGVIIGCLKHPGRAKKNKIKDSTAYASEFNGLETLINKDGEYTFTFKGQPTNLNDLDKTPNGSKLAKPQYDKEVGTTYYKFDKTGGFTLSDNATKDPQSFHIDKKEGKIVVTSGKIVLTMTKKDESVSLKNKTTSFDTKDLIDFKTKAFKVKATEKTSIETPKVAIGTKSVELLDQLIKLIEALGTVTAISPVGPCATLKAAPQWPQVDKVKESINSIKGGF
jgi:hypothetical protein